MSTIAIILTIIVGVAIVLPWLCMIVERINPDGTGDRDEWMHK